MNQILQRSIPVTEPADCTDCREQQAETHTLAVFAVVNRDGERYWEGFEYEEAIEQCAGLNVGRYPDRPYRLLGCKVEITSDAALDRCVAGREEINRIESE